MPFSIFFVYIAMQWWAQKYSDGGGIIVQRMSACKDEKHSLLATLWFNFAHYGIRTWPWILAALAAMVLYHGNQELTADPELRYPRLMVDLLPSGLLGIMIASLLAAFMSTIDTHLNWGASYLVNDFYKRFVRKSASNQEYVLVSRLSMVLLMGIAAVITWHMESIGQAWKFIIAFGSGAGLVYILRWFWWRINAWSELSAIVTSGVVASLIYGYPNEFAQWIGIHPSPGVRLADYRISLDITLPCIVLISTVVWVVVTYFTPPTDEKVLQGFYLKVRPNGKLWHSIAVKTGVAKTSPLWPDLLNWILGVVFVYCAMFGIGKLLLEEFLVGGHTCRTGPGKLWNYIL